MARSKPEIDLDVWRQLGKSFQEKYPDAIHIAETLVDKIQRLIISKDLRAGSRLPSERDLVEILGVSRPTVSKVIKMLALHGLVEARRGSGTYITREPETTLIPAVDRMLNLNLDSVLKLSEVRVWLEIKAMEQAIANASEADIATVKKALDDLSVIKITEVANWMGADLRFHSAIASASKNPYLEMFFVSAHNAIVQFEFRDWITKNTTPSWLNAEEFNNFDIHEEMYLALKNRDLEAGRRAVTAHQELMREHVLATIE